MSEAQYAHRGAFNKVALVQAYRKEFGRNTPNGMLSLLAMMERDTQLTDIRWMAYMLATVATESRHTFCPVDEIGKGDMGVRKIRDETGRMQLIDRGKNATICR